MSLKSSQCSATRMQVLASSDWVRSYSESRLSRPCSLTSRSADTIFYDLRHPVIEAHPYRSPSWQIQVLGSDSSLSKDARLKARHRSLYKPTTGASGSANLQPTHIPSITRYPHHEQDASEQRSGKRLLVIAQWRRSTHAVYLVDHEMNREHTPLPDSVQFMGWLCVSRKFKVHMY